MPLSGRRADGSAYGKGLSREEQAEDPEIQAWIKEREMAELMGISRHSRRAWSECSSKGHGKSKTPHVHETSSEQKH